MDAKMPWPYKCLRCGAELADGNKALYITGLFGCRTCLPNLPEQRDLPEDAAKVLHENLWDLYQ